MAKKSKATNSSAIPALRWLAAPEKAMPQTVLAVFGDEPFLRRSVLVRIRELLAQSVPEGTELSISEFNGPSLTWETLWTEVSTFSMFGPALRLVVIRDADTLIPRTTKSFVDHHRELLERYLTEPSETAILVLEMQSCASNTRLYKRLVEHGLLVDCRALKKEELLSWVVYAAQNEHHFQITNEAARMLIDQIGDDMGLLNQELARLALLADPKKPISIQMVRQNTGTWRVQTAWTLVDCILDGQADKALQYLGQLLDAGEEPIAILAQIASNLRRLALATRLIYSARRSENPLDIQEALVQAGVNAYYAGRAEVQLRRLGATRGKRLLDWMVALDFDLKGDSTLPKRLLLERFVLRLVAAKAG